MSQKNPAPARESEEVRENEPLGFDLPMSAEDEGELMKLADERCGEWLRLIGEESTKR